MKTINSENAKYFELLSEKQAKGEALNGWDENIIRLMKFKKRKEYPENWCNQKIKETLSERERYLTRERHK